MTPDWKIPASEEDPLLRSSRRELRVALLFWAAFATWTVGFAKLFAYDTPAAGEPIALILGIPAWVFWGVVLPWIAATLFTIWFALFSMTDHELVEGESDPKSESKSGEGES